MFAVPTIGFERPLYLTTENNSVEVCAVLMPPPSLNRSIVVILSTVDGTAKGIAPYNNNIIETIYYNYREKFQGGK